VTAVDAALAQMQRRGRTETIGFLAVGAVARAATGVPAMRSRTAARRHGRRARPRSAGSDETRETAGRRRRRQKPGRKYRLIAVGGGHEGRRDERRAVERLQRRRILAGRSGMMSGGEAIEHGVRAGVMVVLLLDPTGGGGSVSATPPRRHV